VSDGYRRNAELSRAAIVTAAGGAVIAMSQQAALEPGPAEKIILLAGGAVVALGLVFALRSLFGRRGDADQ
jgi:hypothetical protein